LEAYRRVFLLDIVEEVDVFDMAVNIAFDEVRDDNEDGGT